MDPLVTMVGLMAAAIAGLFGWLVKLLYERGSEYRGQRDELAKELKAHTDVLPQIAARLDQLDRLERDAAARTEGRS